MNAFSSTYAEARASFLAAAQAHDADIGAYEHPTERGVDGERLFLDVARIGARDASRVVVIGSGTHGIEGYAGSAVQIAWMQRAAASALPPDTAVVLTHAHNPWGFSHRNRVTEENVDLNRNFIDHGAPYPPNPGYDEIHPGVCGPHWDEAAIDRAFATLAAFKARRGEQEFSDALNGGQYSRPTGVFFGGHREQFSNGAFRRAIAEFVGHAQHAGIIDFHTGIGPFLGHIFLCFHAPGSAAHARARDWWGERAVNREGVNHAAVARYRGLLVDAFCAALPEAHTTAVVVEFGTLAREAVQRANLGGSWLYTYGACDPARAARARADLDAAFYPVDPRWRAAVLEQGPSLVERAVEGIARR